MAAMALEALLLVAASLVHQGVAVSQGDSHVKMFGQWCENVRESQKMYSRKSFGGKTFAKSKNAHKL